MFRKRKMDNQQQAHHFKLPDNGNGNAYSDFFSSYDTDENFYEAPMTLAKVNTHRQCMNDDPTRSFGRRIQSLKMITLILIPCIALAAVTISSLVKDALKFNQANQVKETVDVGIKFAKLIQTLQIERGQTVIYVSSGYKNVAFKSVHNKRIATNEAIEEIQPWPKADIPVYYLSNATVFLNYLKNHRDNIVDIENTTVANELTFYSDIIANILTSITTRLHKARTEELWNDLVGYQMLISGTEETAIERALGAVYFSQSQLSQSQLLEYYSKLQLGKMNIKAAKQYSDFVKKEYEKDIVILAIFKLLTKLRNEISVNAPHMPSVIRANLWFDNMTVYIGQLSIMQKQTIAYITNNSNIIRQEATNNFIISIALLVSVGIICPLLLYLTTTLTRNIQLYAINLADKTKKLDRERKKTDSLLCQMLPRSVAEQLKHGKNVMAETYDDVTLYFSDIVGFTQICHESTAMEVVEMLNYLYVQFDSEIEHYLVYKVETIGDAYMVVSGLPKKLPKNQHAIEIANMALALLNIIKTLKVPHNPDLVLQLRAGIHSG